MSRRAAASQRHPSNPKGAPRHYLVRGAIHDLTHTGYTLVGWHADGRRIIRADWQPGQPHSAAELRRIASGNNPRVYAEITVEGPIRHAEIELAMATTTTGRGA